MGDANLRFIDGSQMLVGNDTALDVDEAREKGTVNTMVIEGFIGNDAPKLYTITVAHVLWSTPATY